MPRLARVLSRGTANGITERAIRGLVRQGYAQRWEAADKSTIVTQLCHEPAGLVCHVWLAEGTLDPLLELHDAIVAWAHEQGCHKMRITGRKGWLRMGLGYHEVATVMEREL